MKFKIGKDYIHTSGKRIRIVGKLKKIHYGIDCFVAENIPTGDLFPVGMKEENAVNWRELN